MDLDTDISYGGRKNEGSRSFGRYYPPPFERAKNPPKYVHNGPDISPNLLRLLKNGHKLDSFAVRSERHFNATTSRTYLRKYMTSKLVKHRNTIGAMKKITKTQLRPMHGGTFNEPKNST